MLTNIQRIFDTSDFPRRWDCGNWSPELGWLHISSDVAIFLAYASIPILLVVFVLRRKDTPFLPIFWLFAAFILFCGFGHLVEATLFWSPWYRFSGLIKMITAIVSWVTVLALVPVLPIALRLPGLASLNTSLQAEINERKKLEADLRTLNAELERRVQERTKQLSQSNQQLAQEQFLLNTLVDTLPDRVFFKDQKGAYIRVNQALANDAGVESPEALIGKTAAEVWPAEQVRQTEPSETHVLKTGEPIINKEELRTLHTGEQRWVSITRMPIRDESNTIIGLFGMARDINQQKRHAEELETHRQEAIRAAIESEQARRDVEQTQEVLARSNADLEQFAYVASHDLQEPLRAVSGFCQLLKRRYGETLDDKAVGWIDNAVEGAQRMQSLISDLLEFSRVNRKGDEFQSTDVSEIVTVAVQLSRAAVDESNATVTYDSLPTLMVDKAQLTRVFQNLISNAIKYRGDQPPHISIEARDREADWLFSVRDNGIGVAPEFHERIFIIFQRLHTREEYPGTGIGLAVCQRIIDRHGGRIWVESEVGQGSTFYFTLPKPNNDHE